MFGLARPERNDSEADGTKMISALLFMNVKGEVLISRIYRDDVGYALALKIAVAGKIKLIAILGEELQTHLNCKSCNLKKLGHL